MIFYTLLSSSSLLVFISHSQEGISFCCRYTLESDDDNDGNNDGNNDNDDIIINNIN